MVFQPCAAAGLQALSDGGLDLTRIGFCQAGVRKRESGMALGVDTRKFIYRGEVVLLDKVPVLSWRLV